MRASDDAEGYYDHFLAARLFPDEFKDAESDEEEAVVGDGIEGNTEPHTSDADDVDCGYVDLFGFASVAGDADIEDLPTLIQEDCYTDHYTLATTSEAMPKVDCAQSSINTIRASRDNSLIPATPTTSTLFASESIDLLPVSTALVFGALARCATAANAIESFSETYHGRSMEHIFQTVIDPVRNRRAKTWSDAANDVKGGLSDKNDAKKYKNNYLVSSEALLQSSQNHCSTYMNKLLKRFQRGDDEGLMLLFSVQSDEASSKLRVKDDAARLEVMELQMQKLRKDQAKGLKRTALPSHTIVCKVQYSELCVYSVTKNRKTGAISLTTFGMPRPLEHFDRCTAENLQYSQESLMDLPGLDTSLFSQYKHVGVAPCQDQSGANEKQINAGAIEDCNEIKFGGKKRFRITTRCGVHAWQRCITSQLGFCRSLISGLVSMAITQRQASKLDSLREVIGDELVRMLVIMRTNPS